MRLKKSASASRYVVNDGCRAPRMKVLIVQGICMEYVHPGEMKNFWDQCMKTVSEWATRRGWDYKLFTEARNDDFNISTWQQSLIPGRETISQNQFYKFQWMDGWDNYDHVYWIDSDCYIYGDPNPFDLNSNSNHPAMISCNFFKQYQYHVVRQMEKT